MKVNLHKGAYCMTVMFCGHANFISNEEDEREIISFLEETVGNDPAEFLFGGYGNFDEFSYLCGRKYKEKHPCVKLIFVTPYMTDEYQKNHLEHIKNKYDLIIYPEIENKPLKYAIVYRNQYMVDVSDVVIACVKHEYGGAYKTLKYAMKKNKRIKNIREIT